ncbi:MAG: polymerase, sigma 54 subunit, RpoN/SigL [Pseudomonadota bacterium]|jgi:RNA polymerase sigma-54 factor
MTPQLQQAIKLLQLGRLEYKEAIEKELLENPVLEEMKELDDDPSGSKSTAAESDTLKEPQLGESAPEQEAAGEGNPESKVDWEDYLESFIDSRGSATPKGTIDHEDRPSIEATLTKGESLVDHVVAQLRHVDLDRADEEIAVHIVGNLDKDGYLCASFEEIAEECGVSVEEAERVVRSIQQLDPPGLAARNLGECLLIQLEQMGLENALESRIVRNHLDKLENRRYDQIAKAESVAVDDVYKAITTIQQLEPRPGRPFADDSIRYIVPDIYVYKVGGEYVISLNEDGLPRLRVNPMYLELLRQDGADNVPNKTYLTERLKAASWLIKSIHQRQNTIYRVTESIVKFQRDFLDHGIEKLRPLVLKDVADDIDMHESTVSRVTTNKYVHTPQGVFELKYFFTTAIKTAGGEMSSSTIKERIKNIIAAEKPEAPISDQEIAEILGKENIDIARRTVAKYREGLGILSSSKRKKLF